MGTPFSITAGSWYTWLELTTEIATQAQRFIKFNESVTLSQRDRENKILGNINENVSEEDDAGHEDTKFRKIRKYDSSQFSNKMSTMDKKAKVKNQLGPLIGGPAGKEM